MRRLLPVFFLLLVCVACSQSEKADALSALNRPQTSAMPTEIDIDALKKCCDENARAMGAECCQQLDSFMKQHAGMMGNEDGQGAGSRSMHSGRPVQVPPEVAARWPQVKLTVGPKNAAGTEFTIGVGEKKAIPGTTLEIEVVAFVPAFKMNADAVTSDGTEPTNPAAKVTIREAGKPDWTGWLFAKMPEVHAFEHDQFRVRLLAGIARE